MFSIPFSLPDAYGGMADADGILGFDGNTLRLEFQVKDAIFGIVKSGVKEIELDVSEVASIQFKRKVFRGQILLRSHSVNAVSEIPGQKGGELKITVKKRYCDDAEELISNLRLAVTEARLKALDEKAQKNFEK